MVTQTPVPDAVAGLVLRNACSRMQVTHSRSRENLGNSLPQFNSKISLFDHHEVAFSIRIEAMIVSDLKQTIQTELVRLQLHPVNLDVVSEVEGQATLRGSLLAFWKVPRTVEANWFLEFLRGLPNNLGPEATMNAFAAAIAALPVK